MTADIALAASSREWPDRLHRFLLDHGGGRIVDRVMGPDQAVEESFDVLIIDDICSFLTPRLVTVIKQSGSEVIGVFVPEDGSDAKRRLLECGISDVIESEAEPEEFVEKIHQTLAHRSPVDFAPASSARAPLTIAVTGPSAGVGMTEVAISLADALAGSVGTTLLDLDPVWPSIAQRLDMPLHPNIRTALDHAMHEPSRLAGAVHHVGRLMVIGGRADGGQGAPITRHESVTLIEALSDHCAVVVADLGPVFDVEGGLIREFDNVIVVGEASPVGVARLMRATDRVLANNPGRSVLAVVNMTTKSSFQRSETLGELGRAFPTLPVVMLPFDRRLAEAAWDGVLASSSRYGRAVRAMSSVVERSLS